MNKLTLCWFTLLYLHFRRQPELPDHCRYLAQFFFVVADFTLFSKPLAVKIVTSYLIITKH